MILRMVMRKLPIATKLQYLAEFLKELGEERGELRYSINAREDDIPQFYMGLEVSSGALVDWCEEGIQDLVSCIKAAHSDRVATFDALLGFVEVVAENDTYSGA